MGFTFAEKRGIISILLIFKIELKEGIIVNSKIRTKQMGIFIPPALAEDVKKVAYLKRTSINQLTNEFYEELVANNQHLITQYDELFKDQTTTSKNN